MLCMEMQVKWGFLAFKPCLNEWENQVKLVINGLERRNDVVVMMSDDDGKVLVWWVFIFIPFACLDKS